MGGRQARVRLGVRAVASIVALIVTVACGNVHPYEELRAAADAADGGGAGSPASPIVTGTGAVGEASLASGTESAAKGTDGAPGLGVPPAGGDGSAATAAAQHPPGGRPQTGPVPPAGEGQEAPGSVVRIGLVGTFSGVGASQRGTAVAVQAWAGWINDRGGLSGHPVEVLVVDDQADASRLRAALQQLVEVEHVIAFVGAVTTFSMSPGAAAYLESERVPMIGGDRLHELWNESPMLFPQASAGAAAIWIHVLHVAHAAGPGARLGLLSCQEAQQCRDSQREVPGFAEQLGLDLVYQGQVSVLNPDFTVQCRQAQSSGVEYFLLAIDPNSVRRAVVDCRRQGFSPVFTTPQTAAAFAHEDALDGLGFASATFPFVGSPTPAMAQFQDVMAAYAPGWELSGHASSGWVAAKLFERAAAGFDADPTRAELLESLWSLHGETLGGLTAPLTFVRDQPAPPVYCYFPMIVSDHRWLAQSDGIICQAPRA